MRISHCFSPGLFALSLATASLASSRADWTFHSIPLSNISVFDLAAREDTLLMYSSLTLGLYRSRDDGRTWNLQDHAGGDHYGLEADGEEIFFFGSGILRSRDNGDSWQAAKGVEGEVSDIFPLGSILYAATSEGTYRSADRGDSWKRVHPAMESEFYSMTSVDGILFASCFTLNQDSSLFRSDDNGLSWKLVKLPDTSSLGFVSSVTGHGGHLYLITDRVGLLRGRPDGSGWEHFRVGGGTGRDFKLWSEGTTLYAYSKAGLFQSPDSGTTWYPHGQEGGRGEAFLRSVKGSRLFEQTADHEVNESRDNGASWRRLAIPKRPTEQLGHLFSSGPNLIAYRRAGKSYHTRDLGRTWSGPIAPVGAQFHAFAETGGRLFASVGYGNYQHSMDHGVTWSSLRQPAGNTRLTSFLAAQDGWLYSGSDYVYRRPADTASLPWEACPVQRPAPLPPSGSYFTQAMTAGSMIFAGSWDGRWQYSADSGASWKPVDSVLQAAKPRALAGGTALVAATAQGVYRSPDGERDWIKVDAGLDAAFSALRHGTALFVGGREGRIAYSLDQGLTWRNLDTIPGMDTVASMAVQAGSLAVLSPLQGIWSMPLPEGVVAVKPPPEASEAGLKLPSGTMRPGDAVGVVLREPALVRLVLHAVDGRRLAILRTGRLGAGRHEVRLDPARLRGLPRGRYLLELRAGNWRWSAGFRLDR